jgi:hypothetical protein
MLWIALIFCVLFLEQILTDFGKAGFIAVLILVICALISMIPGIFITVSFIRHYIPDIMLITALFTVICLTLSALFESKVHPVS